MHASLRAQVERLQKKPPDQLSYLKAQLKEDATLAQAIYDYALEKKGIISAENLSLLALEMETKEAHIVLSVEFLRLAADAGSYTGCHHYAKKLFDIPGQAQEALKYSRKSLVIRSKEHLSFHYDVVLANAIVHEGLMEWRNAMSLYCEVTKEANQYSKAVEGRARVVQLKIREELGLNITPDAPAPTLPLEEHGSELPEVLQPQQALVRALTLPDDISIPMTFKDHWSIGGEWFDLADPKKIEAEFGMRIKQLKALKTAKRAEISVLEEIAKGLNDSAGIDTRINTLKADLEKLKSAKTELKLQHQNFSPQAREAKRRYKAERRFFDHKRSKKREASAVLTEKILSHRFNSQKKEVASIPLGEHSARAFITAEAAFQSALVSLCPPTVTGKYGVTGIPSARLQTFGRSRVIEYGPLEKYQVGGTECHVEHRVAPKKQRLGDSYLPQHGDYNKIYATLLSLATEDVEKEKVLAGYMLRYSRAHQSITLAELQALKDSVTSRDVDEFNRICFLVMEKEQCQWHEAASEEHQLGMAVSQARSLVLVQAGVLSFKDVFVKSAIFGAYSQVKLVDDPASVAKAAEKIDELYKEYLKGIKPAHSRLPFFRDHVRKADSVEMVLTQRQAHEDLQAAYGGSSDTDGEGYETGMDDL